MSKFLSEGDAAYDNVYEVASKALKDAQQEIRNWRIRAEDAEKDLEALREEWSESQRKISHLVRMIEIHNQITEQKDLAIAAYKNMVDDLQSAGMVHRQSEEIVGLQTKLKHALACVPRGDSETFVFDDGDEAEYGQDTQYSEAQLAYFSMAHPLAMSCINRLHAMIGDEDRAKQVIRAAKHALSMVHQRTQVGNEVCPFTGKIKNKPIWLTEREDHDEKA